MTGSRPSRGYGGRVKLSGSIRQANEHDRLKITGGHVNWATPDVMRILPNVENCVHLIAMHELRKNFPLDTVLVNRELPTNCLEFAYPGSHSDVGGGYEPGELGVSASDAMKLSQVPLNHLYECALAAGVPLSKARGKEDFSIHRDLLRAFEEFIDVSKEAPRSLSDWMLPYLVWRWQVRQEFEKTSQVMRANPDHRRHLIDSNRQFCAADEELKIGATLSFDVLKKKRPYDRDRNQATMCDLAPLLPDTAYRLINADLSPAH